MTITHYDRSLEVNGAYLIGAIDSLNEQDVRQYRERHGLMHIDPNKWYPADQVVAFYNDIESAPNGMFNLVAIGLHISEVVQYPPYVKTMSDALKLAQDMHYAGWRNGNPGDLTVKVINDRHVQFIFENLPLPSDLVYGLCYGMVKRFAPKGTNIRVAREERDRALHYDLMW